MYENSSISRFCFLDFCSLPLAPDASPLSVESEAAVETTFLLPYELIFCSIICTPHSSAGHGAPQKSDNSSPWCKLKGLLLTLDSMLVPLLGFIRPPREHLLGSFSTLPSSLVILFLLTPNEKDRKTTVSLSLSHLFINHGVQLVLARIGLGLGSSPGAFHYISICYMYNTHHLCAHTYTYMDDEYVRLKLLKFGVLKLKA